MWGTAVVLATAAPAAATAEARTLPDLRMVRASFTSAPEVAAGTSIGVRDRIANVGRAKVRRSSAAYYLSLDRVRSSGDTRLGSRRVRALRPHAQSRASLRLRVPATVAEGTYRVIACADAPRRIRERAERNNCAAAARSVSVFEDTEPPTVTIASPVPGGATLDTTPSFFGTASTEPGDDPGVVVRVWAGAATTGTPALTLATTTAGDGRWGAEADADAALARGTYTARAEQSDAAGNVALSEPVTFAIGPATLLAAGDIGSCASRGDEDTAQLLAAAPAASIAVLGDSAYENGSLSDFERCFAPSWGVHRARIHPTPGNHDYLTEGAAGYFEWYGAAAGEPGRGYYSYELGTWHVVVLNSNCNHAGGCQAGSPQERWLARDLAEHPARCTLAYWHHPMFSSDPHGGTTSVRALWDRLYAAGAEAVLNGHAHHYERFAPKRPDGTIDAARGIREFVAGSGGRSLTRFSQEPADGSEHRYNANFGVLRLTLDESSFAWEFEPVAGIPARDRGSQRCH